MTKQRCSGGGATVLIVEDQVVPEGRALERILKKAGYKVLAIAETAERAVSEAAHHRPAVVIMDITLGNHEEDHYAGIMAARRIRQVTDAQIIYLTGLPQVDEMLQKAIDTHPFGFLTKPYTAKQILMNVRMAVLGRPHEKLCFICYAHKDTRMIEELERFLQPLAWAGIDIWVDTKIGKGRKWKDEINDALKMAKAAVLLVSMDFVLQSFRTSFLLRDFYAASFISPLISTAEADSSALANFWPLAVSV